MAKAKSPIEKARAFFALANNNPNENEAEAAMRAYQRLMDEHGFTAAELAEQATNGTNTFDQTEAGKVYKSLPNWYMWLAMAAGAITDAKTVRWTDSDGRRSMKWRGVNGDSELALMMFDYLTETMNRMMKAEKKLAKENGEEFFILDFRRGYCSQMLNRANAIKAEREEERQAKAAEYSEAGTSLVVLKNQLIEDHFGKLKPGRKARKFTYRSDASLTAGSNAADRTGLNTQVGGKSQRQLA